MGRRPKWLEFENPARSSTVGRKRTIWAVALGKADAALRISFARRSSRFSRSSWRMRSFSSLVTPGRFPPATSARRSQMRSVSGVIPNLLAIEPIAAPSEGCSPRCSITIRTARCRSSYGCLVGLVIAPSSQGLEPPGNPGRFISRPVVSLPRSYRPGGRDLLTRTYVVTLMIKVLFENAPLGFSPGHNLPPGSRLKRLMRRRLRVITDANRSSSEPGDRGGTENPGVGGSIPT